MRDKDLYAQILSIKSPWQVSSVELALSEEEVTVQVEQEAGAKQCCSTCGQISHRAMTHASAASGTWIPTNTKLFW
ncbi:hypothetical protein [Candidatus Vondammii sp. HM_W22]|uniref:hypothetical protein n=1 Tax=Candidatus Vondammii sp. HM_W22 TaxID=2687299 RepID=UPI001F1425AE|nr:hypothetical protein [Candidatus Vondammii sp. HM_W22]